LKKVIPRAHVREKVDIAADLIHDARRHTIIPCRIVDRSEGGIKIEMPAAFPLPDRVFLQMEECEERYEYQKRWQNGEQAGLMFVSVANYSAHVNTSPKFESSVVLWASTEDVDV
jgi:PilZ domain